MLKHQKFIFWLIGAASLIIPGVIFADYGYFTMPIAASDTNSPIVSWFDHTSPLEGDDTSTVLTRYDGVKFTTSTSVMACDKNIGNCYSGHSGIDFSTLGVEGKNVLAAASGTVRQVQWQDPNNTSSSSNFGFFVRLWHPQYGVSTLYGHTTSSITYVTSTVGQNAVTRGQVIAKSGQTGCSTPTNSCPHLHFQVYNADDTVTSSPPTSGFHWADSVDPYGYSGPGGLASDTWPNEAPFGYMWASKAATSSYVTTTTGLMTASTTWLKDQIYIIQGTLTVSSTATLTIKQGAVVKFNSTTSQMIVDGKLDVQGTSTDPVYFTSIEDDSVGGDMNDDATATTPGTGNWDAITLDAKSTTTIKNAIIRYGGSNDGTADADIYINGGYLSATSTVIASSSFYGLQIASGTVKVTTSTFIGNLYDGFRLYGAANVTVTTSSFVNNGTGLNSTDGVAQVDYNGGGTFTVSGNTSTGNYRNGFVVRLTLGVSSTWSNDLPYVIQGGGVR